MHYWCFLVAWACCFASIVCAAPLANSSSLGADNGVLAAVKPFVWASLGDLRSSGGDICLRNNQAYAIKVSEDSSWVPEGREQDFHDQTCSQGNDQLDDIKDNTDMILLQAGGSNANLAAVAYACILAPEGKDWGPAYPDSRGRCYQEIEKSQQYIFGKGENQLFQDTREKINAVLGHEKVKKNPDFRLVISGSLELFYAEAKDDWCDSASFALRKNDRPMLSLALRKKINELVRGSNDAVKDAVAGSSHPDRAQFVDPNAQIEGHRFCQPGHTMLDQYFGNKVCLWNLSPDGILKNPSSGSAGNGANSTREVRQPTLEEFQRWQDTGLFTTDPGERHVNMTDVANAGLSIAPPPSTGGEQIDEYRDWALRAFHPNDEGHAAIAQTIIDTVQKAPPKKPTPINTEPRYKYSIQILLAQHGNKFSWYMYRGPYGKPVDPCYPENRGFVRLVTDYPEERTGLSLNAPPYLEFGTEWDFTLYEGSGMCTYRGYTESPGWIRCGQWLDFPFSKDAGYYSKNVHCNVDSRNLRAQDYHQAWVLEY